MTAIERVTQAGRDAGFEVTESPSASWVTLKAPDRAVMIIRYDRVGRLTSARHHVAGGVSRTMPAAGVEARIVAWIEEHKPAPAPAAEAIFDALEQAYVEIDGFGTRDEYVSPGVTNVASGNAVVGQQLGHVSFGPEDRYGRGLARMGRERAAQERSRAYADDGQAAGVSLDRLGRDDRVSFELGLLDPEEGLVTHAATLTRDQAEALYALLGEHFGG